MALLFYFQRYSTSDLTAAVLAELEHGLPEPIAKRIELNIEKGDTRTPDYLKKVNPNGLVPAIVHNGVSIWEAAAVTMYLGETFGVKRSIDGAEAEMLYPGPGTSRGEAMKWLVWASTHLFLSATKFYKPAESQTQGSRSLSASLFVDTDCRFGQGRIAEGSK